jgi:NDP-sugar pyrophosphorylase family protein
LYGDNYSSLNFRQLVNQKKSKKNSILITVCEKKNNGNIELNKKNKLIKKYFFNKRSFLNYVEIGYMILEKKILPKTKNPRNVPFNEFINQCVEKKKALYYLNKSGYYSISDIDRLEITRKFFKNFLLNKNNSSIN